MYPAVLLRQVLAPALSDAAVLQRSAVLNH
jgi:hypothetical protein